jgi:putative transposase
VGRGKTVLEAVKKIGVTEQTYYCWKKQFGGLRIDQAKRLKDLEKQIVWLACEYGRYGDRRITALGTCQ